MNIWIVFFKTQTLVGIFIYSAGIFVYTNAMELSTTLLLLSAFFHASWNALAKKSNDKEIMLLSMVFFSSILTLISIFMTGVSFTRLSVSTWIFTVLAGIFEGLYMVTLSRALNSAELGKVYAIMRGGAMICVWVISILFLNEVVKWIHVLGSTIVWLGIVIMSYQQQQKTKSGLSIWPYLSALCISGYHLSYHQALKSEVHPQILFFISMLISFFILLIFMKQNTYERFQFFIKSKWKSVILISFFSTASFLIFLYALKVAQPGYAISLRNSSIFFAIGFSYLLKEKLTPYQILGALTIGLGTIFLSMPN